MTLDESSRRQYELMTQTPVSRLVPKLAIPTIISNIITSIYNLADTCFVSAMNSDSATASVGIIFALMAVSHFFGVYGVIFAQPVADVLCCLTNIPFLILFLRRINKLEAEQKQSAAQ